LDLTGVSCPLLLRILGRHGWVVVVRGVPDAVEIVVISSARINEKFPGILNKRRTAYYLVLKSHHWGVIAVVLVHEGENWLQVTGCWRGFDASWSIFFE
jgi:hypothetical protein